VNFRKYPNNQYKKTFLMIQTAERNTAHLASDNVILHRHLIAYKTASEMIRGKVLEVGCGEGYGISMLAPVASDYTAIDKFNTTIDEELKKQHNITFQQMNVPPFTGIASDTFDYIVCFQVIEHIQTDKIFVQELYRVLKPGGTLILTTPNIKQSLTRNPWHIREYTIEQLNALFLTMFRQVEVKGVFGNEKVMQYHEKNRASVKAITRFDILNLQYRLPRQLLQIPYDILNRINRNRLMKAENALVLDVQTDDFYIAPATDGCLDLFVVATKSVS